jgi:hypothetical protein
MQEWGGKDVRSYEAARALFGFLGFLFWCGAIIGVVIAIAAMQAAGSNFGRGSGVLAAFPGIFIAGVSMLGVAIIQSARASVDTAELTQQMLKVARDQLEVSKQALRQGSDLTRGFAALGTGGPLDPEAAARAVASFGSPSFEEPLLGSNAPEKDHMPDLIPLENGDYRYFGRPLLKAPNGYTLEGKTYDSLVAAMTEIDKEMALRPTTQKAPV